ncbi:hypothetical protein AK812_SmicGene26257 [Symbiodinium microadriaticum]|uniref:Uncharacterized protein n=1 Tax=Symbiodinium microadriaticum TaxID=2951 RepID=A0A1Q9D9V8_SYMMI|nr:hypothetical protein AK812_SmicGene26257 [Symbiodinium microadriaticum]
MTLLPAWAVLENVRGILSHKIPLDQAFRTAGVFQKYWAILVPLCPQETLKEPHRRPRVYILLARKDRCLVGGTEQLQELVATMYHEVAHSMECLDVRELLDPETPGWTEQNLAEVQGGNGTKWITEHNTKRLEVGLQPVAYVWKAGFTPRSWSTMEIWQEVYKTNVEPVFCDLSQNLHRCPIGEGFLPCLTTSAQVCVLNTKHGPRRLTALELLAFQGFPVEKKSFQQLVQGFDAAKLRFMAGNTMHVRCVGMAMLMAMCLLGWPSGPKSVPPDQSKNQTGILVMTWNGRKLSAVATKVCGRRQLLTPELLQQVRAVLFFVSESAFGKFPAMAPGPQPQAGEKRAAAAAKVVVPATEKKQKVENGGAGQKPPAEPLTQPAMPEDEHAGAGAFMRKVVPWAPKTADRYKENWRPSNCLIALEKNKVYEAAGNITWVNALSDGRLGVNIPREEPALAQVIRLASRFEESPDKSESPLLWYTEGVPATDYPQTVFCLAGTALVWAWWYSVYKALSETTSDTSSDLKQVRRLWQTGLSATLTLHLAGPEADILLQSLSVSEDYGTAEDLKDDFPIWSRKVALLLDEQKKKATIAEQERYLWLCFGMRQANNVRFRGTKVTRAVINAVVAMRRFNARAHDLLRAIRVEYGPTIFSDGFSKLVRFSQTVGTLVLDRIVPGEDFQEEALVFSFGLALVLLRREDVQPSFFSSRNLESRDKKQGWMTMTFLKFLLVSNLLKFPEQLKMETLTSVLKQLETPLAFHKAFPAAPAGSEEAVKAVPEESVVSEVNKLTEDQKRFFGLIRDLYEGEYDEDLRCVLAGKNFKLLYDMSSPASENKDLGLYKEYNECLRLLNSNSRETTSATGLSSSGPGLDARSLAMCLGDEDGKEAKIRERKEIYNKAVCLRKKLVQFSIADFSAGSNMFDRSACDAVRAHVPKLNEEYHALAKVRRISAYMEKIALAQGDFVLMWDGRNVNNRRAIEDALGVLTAPTRVTEFSVHFVSDHAKRPSPGRRVFGAAHYRENGWMKGTVSRVRICTDEREDPYTWSEKGDKAKIFGRQEESKSGPEVVVVSVNFWSNLLTITKAASVLDFSMARNTAHQNFLVNTIDLESLRFAEEIHLSQARGSAKLSDEDIACLEGAQGAKACKRSLEDLFDNPVSGKRPRAGSESKATTMTRSEAVAKSTRQAQSRKAGKSESKASSRSEVVAKSTGQFQSRTAAPRRVGAQSRRLKILPQKQKRPPVRQTNKKKNKVDIHMRLQSTVDTAEHAAEHPNPKEFMGSCARCRFLVRRHAWQDVTTTNVLNSKVQLNWLGQRPSHMGGDWGLGCLACATLLTRAGGSSLQGHRLNTKWARFEVRTLSNMQAEKHSRSDLHKLAVRCWSSPGAPEVVIQEDSGQAFSGGVPQVSDFLRIWRTVTTGSSFRDMEKITFTESFIQTQRSDVASVTRFACKQLLQVLQERVRQEKVKALLEASSMTLVVDDKAEHRVIRYFSNVFSRAGSGVIAVLRFAGRASSATLDDFGEDYCVRLADSVLDGLRRFATPMKQDLDVKTYNHLLHICRAFTTDGCPAALKSGRILAQSMPNLLSAQKPQLAEDAWSEVGGAPLQSIIKSLSFAPQRWNSEDEPLRRFGVMVQEIAVLLAAQASDARQTPDFRARCQTSLEKLTPRFLLDAGLASDWSNEVLRYLRSHDRDLHDPALTARQYADFKNRLEALFLKLHILDSDTGGIGSETLTKIIVKQAMSCGPIRTGLQMDFCVFDLFAICQAQARDADDWQLYQTLTSKRVKRLLRQGLHMSQTDDVVRGYWGVVHELLARHRDELKDHRFDNRAAWLEVQKDEKNSSGLRSLLAFYLGFQDTSTCAERSLGLLTKQYRDHLGPLEENGLTMTMLVELCQDGPTSEAELATRETCEAPTGQTLVSLEPTEFLLDCSRIWRQHFGSRFQLYKKRSDRGHSKQCSQGTLSQLRERQSSAADTLARKATSRGREHSTIFAGLHRKDLPRPVRGGDNPQFNDKLKKLEATNQKRRAAAQQLAQRRKLPGGSNPFVVGPLRKNEIFTKKRSEARASAERRYLRLNTLNLVDSRSEASHLDVLHEQQNLQVWRPSSSKTPAEVLKQLRKTDLVLISKETQWQQEPREPPSSTQ